VQHHLLIEYRIREIEWWWGYDFYIPGLLVLFGIEARDKRITACRLILAHRLLAYVAAHGIPGKHTCGRIALDRRLADESSKRGRAEAVREYGGIAGQRPSIARERDDDTVIYISACNNAPQGITRRIQVSLGTLTTGGVAGSSSTMICMSLSIVPMSSPCGTS